MPANHSGIEAMRRLLPFLLLLLPLPSPILAGETAEQHLAAFLERDLAGDGFDRLGPFVEVPTGKGSCGCSSSGSHFDIAQDRLMVAEDFRIVAVRRPSPERVEVTVRFRFLGDSRMGQVDFAQGDYRRLIPLEPPRKMIRHYRLERQFDGAWAVLADQPPVVSPQPLVEALSKAEQGALGPRKSYFQQEFAAAQKMLRRTHKKLAD